MSGFFNDYSRRRSMKKERRAFTAREEVLHKFICDWLDCDPKTGRKRRPAVDLTLEFCRRMEEMAQECLEESDCDEGIELVTDDEKSELDYDSWVEAEPSEVPWLDPVIPLTFNPHSVISRSGSLRRNEAFARNYRFPRRYGHQLTEASHSIQYSDYNCPYVPPELQSYKDSREIWLYGQNHYALLTPSSPAKSRTHNSFKECQNYVDNRYAAPPADGLSSSKAKSRRGCYYDLFGHSSLFGGVEECTSTLKGPQLPWELERPFGFFDAFDPDVRPPFARIQPYIGVVAIGHERSQKKKRTPPSPAKADDSDAACPPEGTSDVPPCNGYDKSDEPAEPTPSSSEAARPTTSSSAAASPPEDFTTNDFFPPPGLGYGESDDEEGSAETVYVNSFASHTYSCCSHLMPFGCDPGNPCSRPMPLLPLRGQRAARRDPWHLTMMNPQYHLDSIFEPYRNISYGPPPGFSPPPLMEQRDPVPQQQIHPQEQSHQEPRRQPEVPQPQQQQVEIPQPRQPEVPQPQEEIPQPLQEEEIPQDIMDYEKFPPLSKEGTTKKKSRF